MPSDALGGSVRVQVGFWVVLLCVGVVGCRRGVCVGCLLSFVLVLCFGFCFCFMFCYRVRCCMICGLVAVGCVCLLVSGDLLSMGRHHALVVCRSNRCWLCRVPAWLPSYMCGRSGSCPCAVGVGFRVGFRRCRIVMNCGAVRHR